MSRSAKPTGMMFVTGWPSELVALIAELLLGLNIEQDDLAGLVHHHHRVRGGLEKARGSGPPGDVRPRLGLVQDRPPITNPNATHAQGHGGQFGSAGPAWPLVVSLS